MISDSSERIGLIFSAAPSIACALPIRPPRCRESSVSIANQIFSPARASRAAGATPAGGRRDLVQRRPVAPRTRRREHDEAEAAAARLGVHDLDAPARLLG